MVPINKRAQVLERLRADLSHYDKTFLIKNLSKVYLLNNLSFNKQIYGGTNDHYLQWLYINVRWLGDDSKHIKAMGFHHEFSSILYKKNKSIFNEIKWKHINKKEFKYAYNKSLDTNIKSGKTGLVGNNSLYEEGFICSYGTLTLEDDINTFSQYLIAKPDILKTLINKHKRIKEKVNLLVSFYKDIGYKSAH